MYSSLRGWHKIRLLRANGVLGPVIGMSQEETDAHRIKDALNFLLQTETSHMTDLVRSDYLKEN